VELTIRELDRLFVLRLRFPNERDLIAAPGLDVTVERVVGEVRLPTS